MTREEQLELADKILKAYEAWAKDYNPANMCKSIERLSAEQDDITPIIELNLCEEAITACIRVIAGVSHHFREVLVAEYHGLQGYYRKKRTPAQVMRSRRVRFSNEVWECELHIVMTAFINLLKKEVGNKFNKYFVSN